MLGYDTQTATLALSAMAGRQLALFSLFIPAYLVVLFAGWRRMVEIWPAVTTAGVTFAVGQFVVSNFVGPELTASLAALFSLASVALLLRVWHPRHDYAEGSAAVRPAEPDQPARVARAYGTYGILIVVVLAGQIGNSVCQRSSRRST
jgi:glycolate permease/lactate permease